MTQWRWKHSAAALLVCVVVSASAAMAAKHRFRTYTVASLAQSDVPDMPRLKETIEKISVVRVPDTAEHALVRDYLIEEFTQLGWTVEKDEFKDATPYGEKAFTNIVATLNPQAKRKLVLAAHYDSKYFEEFEFVAATDSAVPVALLIELAKTLTPSLLEKNLADSTLQIVLFDGEEAFKDWTATDSIYGARHLAEKWEKTPGVAQKSVLAEIEALVLLDLLGAPDPKLHDMFPATSALFQRFESIEKRLRKAKLIESPQPIFQSGATRYKIEDDHIPFLQRGVPILHLINLPFPHVWHKEGDNLSALSDGAMRDLARLFTVFVAEYFRLPAVPTLTPPQ